MARKTSPVVQEKGGSVRGKVIGAAIVLAALAVVVKHPADAVIFVRAAFGWLGAIGDGLASFGRDIAS
ncbi:hypothetical protein [Amycolatopsis sp. NPDC003731]